MLTKLYKLTFDISVCFTIGAFLLQYACGISVHAGGYPVLLLAALLSVLLERKKHLRISVMILLPAGYLALLKPSIPELIIFLLIWAYIAFVTITERVVISRDRFVDMLRRLAYLFIPLAFFLVTGFQKVILSMQAAGPYLTASLISAIFLMRHLRALNHMKVLKMYGRQQFVELIVFMLICLLLTIAKAPQNLVRGLKLTYLHLLKPILTFIVNTLSLILYVIVSMFLYFIGLLSKNKEIQNRGFSSDSAADRLIKIKDSFDGNSEWVVPFLYSVGIIAGLLFAFFFFRRLMGEKLRQKLPADIMELREAIEYDSDRRTKFRKRRPKDAREAVRMYYGRFLLWLKSKRIPLQLQDSTEDINDKYMRALTEDNKARQDASQQLRQLYRKSRYQMAEPITSKEAEKAKQLYKTLRNSKVTGEG